MRKDKEIRGIKIATTDCKLPQYAADTTMIFIGSELSFSKTVNLFDQFAEEIENIKKNFRPLVN